MIEVLSVGISEWKLVERPDHLKSSGLGSCIGLVLYTPVSGMAAMAHIMLPDHGLAKSDFHPAKFADTAVPGLLEMLIKRGVNTSDIKAKLAGGAEMFPSFNNRMSSIGSRNALAIKEALDQLHIPITGEDIGGNAGRTIEFDTLTCALQVRTVKHGERTI